MALAGPHEALVASVLESGALNVDETGWQTAGEQRTLWTATDERAAIFRIASDRHADRLRRADWQRLRGEQLHRVLPLVLGLRELRPLLPKPQGVRVSVAFISLLIVSFAASAWGGYSIPRWPTHMESVLLGVVVVVLVMLTLAGVLPVGALAAAAAGISGRVVGIALRCRATAQHAGPA